MIKDSKLRAGKIIKDCVSKGNTIVFIDALKRDLKAAIARDGYTSLTKFFKDRGYATSYIPNARSRMPSFMKKLNEKYSMRMYDFYKLLDIHDDVILFGLNYRCKLGLGIIKESELKEWCDYLGAEPSLYLLSGVIKVDYDKAIASTISKYSAYVLKSQMVRITTYNLDTKVKSYLDYAYMGTPAYWFYVDNPDYVKKDHENFVLKNTDVIKRIPPDLGRCITRKEEEE